MRMRSPFCKGQTCPLCFVRCWMGAARVLCAQRNAGEKEAVKEGSRRGGKQERRETGEERSRARLPLGMRWQPGDGGALRAGTGTCAARWGPAQACEGDFSDTQMGVCCHGEGSIGRVSSEPLCTCQLVTVPSFAWFCRGQLEHQRAKSKLLPLPTP